MDWLVNAADAVIPIKSSSWMFILGDVGLDSVQPNRHEVSVAYTALTCPLFGLL